MMKKSKIKKLFPKKCLEQIFEILSLRYDFSTTVFTENKKLIYNYNQAFDWEHFEFGSQLGAPDNWIVSELEFTNFESLYLATRCKEEVFHDLLKKLIINMVKTEIDKKQLLGETLDRYHEINALYNISEEVMREFELDSLIDIILDKSVSAVKSKNSLFLLLTEEGNINWQRSRGTFGHVRRISTDFKETIEACLEGNTIKIIENFDNAALDTDTKIEFESAVIVPLSSKSKKIGILIVFDKTGKKGFASSDMKVLNAIATQGAMAIENARLVEKIKIEERRRTTLQRYFSPNIANILINNIDMINTKGEKKAASVLFSDIRDFTKISNSLQPEIVVKMLNEYFSVMNSIIFKYNGTLDKYIGDAIMAEFGIPISSENDTYNAVKTGLEMLDALEELNREWEERGLVPFRIGISINTGFVISGNVGSLETLNFTVIGDTVNLASRLEKLNKRFKTNFLISEYTYQHVKDSFDFKFWGKQEIRGISTPVGVYEVLGEKEE